MRKRRSEYEGAHPFYSKCKHKFKTGKKKKKKTTHERQLKKLLCVFEFHGDALER